MEFGWRFLPMLAALAALALIVLGVIAYLW